MPVSLSAAHGRSANHIVSSIGLTIDSADAEHSSWTIRRGASSLILAELRVGPVVTPAGPWHVAALTKSALCAGVLWLLDVLLV